MRPLRIALLGTEHVHTADHRAAVTACPDAELCHTLDEADAAVICSTTARHGEWLRIAATANLPVLVEKPLAASLAETTALTASVGSGAAVVAMFLRCAPALHRVRSVLATGALGEIVGARLSFGHPGLPDGMFEGTAAWMLDPARGGIGAFADLGIHLIDLLLWLRPDAPIAVRDARFRMPAGMAVDSSGVAVCDWGAVPVTLAAGWTTRPGGLRLRVDGTRDRLVLRDGLLAVGPDVERHAPQAAGDATRAFLAGLRGRSMWRPPTAADVLTCASVLEGVSVAARRA
ncbi:Gfo/Idh/MocA family protein [Nocardia aurantia]|uniref:Oxidoreductase n=1 Tax=Nocardia aurantia TaxID=2585199 RepID=A0A7K0DP00_9NOCA|nr:Gfo/Idh/MocA family oxidoreductase [Nocardia aurantia]MQY27470.1 hypothetical protein [Nocardia aurantia]